MSGKRMCFWRDLSLHNKLLMIMLPLAVLPVMVLGAVGLPFVSPYPDFQHLPGVSVRPLVIITVLSLGVACVLSLTFGRWLSHRLHGLAEAANRLAAGHRSVKVASDSRDEIGRLTDALNDMASSLTQHEATWQRRVDELKTLYEISQEMTAQVALEPVLQLLVERARQLLQSEVSLLALRQEESDTVLIRAHSGLVPPALATLRLKPGAGLGGRVVATGQPIVVGDYLTECLDSPFLDIMQEAGMRSSVAVPLSARHAVIGVLYVHSQAPHQFRAEDCQLLTALADQAAIAIENARRYQQTSQHAEALAARVSECTRELEEANHKLAAASYHQAAFLANMSHELRTPMNAIIGFTRLVLRRAKDVLPQREHENLGKILLSAEHLLALINNILDLSKIEAGRMEVHASSFDLEPLVDLCLHTVEPLVKDERPRLVKDLAANLPALCTDQEKLKQILMNLLSNAVKFTLEGTVTVTARHRDETVALAVADTGMGIPEDALGLVFEKFSQVDSSTTRQYSGTGLGLSISRHLAQLLGGDIAVQSTVGVGSTFTVTLPLHYDIAPLPTPVTAVPARIESVAQPEPKQLVLAIDDDPDVIYLLRENLAEAGYHVVGATSGEEGVQKARALRPFAIMLDILMPRTDGWQILHTLKADVATRDISIIVLSIVDNKALGYRLGAFDSLRKPCDREAILAVLARVPPRRGRLLVVDDDPKMVDLVRQLLADEPYEVLAATDGREALEVIARQRPDVVLLDLFMPQMDGFAVIEHLQQEEQYRRLPIIVCTAKTLTASERTGLEQSVRTVIQKQGLDREALIQEVQGMLQAYHGLIVDE